jgi:His-Xaa-Ser system protein HxsD
MAEGVLSVDNLEVDEKTGNVVISVNPKIYPMNTIFSAAYILIDKAWVLVDGDPNEEIIVQLRRKDKNVNLKELGRTFNNELVNYSVYNVQVEKNAVLRGMIIQKAFETQVQEAEVKKEKEVKQNSGKRKIKAAGKSKGRRK